MTSHGSKVTIHMVGSLDGFIDTPDGNIDWMQTSGRFDKGVTLTESEISEFLNKIDCYVMGARTYIRALELGWPYGDKPVVVATHGELPNQRETVSFYQGDLKKLTDKLRLTFANIWMVGGAQLTKTFVREQLADELVISIAPVLLGGGTPFFDRLGVTKELRLLDSVAYQDGMVELTYSFK